MEELTNALMNTTATVMGIIGFTTVLIIILVLYLIHLLIAFLQSSTEKNKAEKKLIELKQAETLYRQEQFYPLAEKYLIEGEKAYKRQQTE